MLHLPRFCKPMTDRRVLTAKQWRERVRELRRHCNTFVDYYKYGVLLTPTIPMQIAIGVALDYPDFVRASEAPGCIEVVPYLRAQALAEDYWQWYYEKVYLVNQEFKREYDYESRQRGEPDYTPGAAASTDDSCPLHLLRSEIQKQLLPFIRHATRTERGPG